MPSAVVWPSAEAGRTERHVQEDGVQSRASASRSSTRCKALPKTALPMEVLRTAISCFRCTTPEAEDMSPEANVRKAIRLTAQCATIVTAFDRIRNGKEPVWLRVPI